MWPSPEMAEKLEIEFVITVTPVVKNNPHVKVVVDTIFFDQIRVQGTVLDTQESVQIPIEAAIDQKEPVKHPHKEGCKPFKNK